MSVIDEILAHNEAYANQFTKGSLPMPPAKQLAAVVCMDARLETGALLAQVEGDATLPLSVRLDLPTSVS